MPDSSQPAARTISDAARTTISFLLFVHLFALGVAILSNTSPLPEPGEAALPDLKRQLRQVPGIVPYLLALNMDYGYIGGDRYQGADYHLTHYTPWDLPYRIELTLNLPDGGGETTVVIPNETLQPRLRRLRYQMLASRTARLEGYDGPDVQIPYAVATHYVNLYKATGGRLRCLAEFERPMLDLNNVNPAVAQELPALPTNTVLDLYVLVANGKVSLLNAESARDAAAPSATSNGAAGDVTTPPVTPDMTVRPDVQ